MDPVTHVAAGVLISQVMPGPSRGWSTLAGAAFALLPDIDYFMIFADRLAFIRHHRGFTHSLAALFLFALLGAALGRALGGPRWFRPLLFLGLAVLASHLLLDLATSYGTQILFPFSRQRFTLDWLFIIDPYLTGLLLFGAAAALASATWGRTAGTYFLAAAGAYVLLCGFYHQQALTLARQMFHQPAATAPTGHPKRPHTLTLPGQALGYLVGQREILRLRNEARARLGAAFDIRDFHSAILDHGSLPLAVLGQVVSEWVASAAGNRGMDSSA